MVKSATEAGDNLHLEDLKEGLEAITRVCNNINDGSLQVAKERIVRALTTRVADWKGHRQDQFGELLLWDTIRAAAESGIKRNYWVLLFEGIILCCKEDRTGFRPAWRPEDVCNRDDTEGIVARDTPILLKGRICVHNVTEVVRLAEDSTCLPYSQPQGVVPDDLAHSI
jgi:cell division control protein 24